MTTANDYTCDDNITDLLDHLRRHRPEPAAYDPRKPVPAPLHVPPRQRIDLGIDLFAEKPQPLHTVGTGDYRNILQAIEELRAENRAVKREMIVLKDSVTELTSENIEMRDALTRLMQQPAVAGTFPPVREIEAMTVQIFHNSDINEAKRRGGHREWTVKTECTHAGRKQSGITVGMETRDRLLKILREKNAPEFLIEFVQNDMPSDMLGGIVRRSPVPGISRSYVTSQVVFMDGHDRGMNHVRVLAFIEDDIVEVTGFGMGRGDKANRALWAKIMDLKSTLKSGEGILSLHS